MSSLDWKVESLPPLVLSANDLAEITEAAGADASIDGAPGTGVRVTGLLVAVELESDCATLRYVDVADRAATIVRLLVEKSNWRAAEAELARTGTMRIAHAPVSLADLGCLADAAGRFTCLEFADLDESRVIRLTARGLELIVDKDGAQLSARRDDAAVRRVLRRHRRRWSWLTHSDLSILIGMVAPVAAGLSAPSGTEKLAAALAAIPWLTYLWWVGRNASKRWTVWRL